MLENLIAVSIRFWFDGNFIKNKQNLSYRFAFTVRWLRWSWEISQVSPCQRRRRGGTVPSWTPSWWKSRRRVLWGSQKVNPSTWGNSAWSYRQPSISRQHLFICKCGCLKTTSVMACDHCDRIIQVYMQGHLLGIKIFIL